MDKFISFYEGKIPYKEMIDDDTTLMIIIGKYMWRLTNSELESIYSDAVEFSSNYHSGSNIEGVFGDSYSKFYTIVKKINRNVKLNSIM